MIRSTVHAISTLLLVGLLNTAIAAPTAASDPENTSDAPTLERVEKRELLEIVITPEGNKMTFETTEFSVQAGQEVRLVFDNTATSPAMKHNVVIVSSADAIKRVGQAAMSEQDYVPDDEAIVAYTPLANPGETVEVTFTAPDAPGEQPFICTFPGHYMSMQGTMHVTE